MQTFPEPVVVRDEQNGDIKLQCIQLDLVLKQGKWVGHGSREFNAAREGGYFYWPKRCDQLKLTDAVIVPGEANWCPEGKTQAQWCDQLWHPDQYQKKIPSQVHFAIEAAEGATLRGRLLVEYQ